MTDTSLLERPIAIDSVSKASDRLLRRSQNWEKPEPAIPDTMLLSESALSEWDTEEEDIAWASL